MDKEGWRKGAVQCASGARALLTDVLVAAQDAENAAATDESRKRVEALTERLAAASGALFAVQEQKVQEPAAILAKMGEAHRALEKAVASLAELSVEHPHLANGHRDLVARALALVFAAGGGAASSAPPPRRSSTGIQAVRAPSATSSPTIELGEIEAGLAELGLDGHDAPAPSSRRGPPSSASSPYIHAVEVDIAQLDLPPEEAAQLAGTGTALEGKARPAAPAAASGPAEAVHDSDRRESDRVTLEADVGFVTESNFYAGLSMDMSEGGLFVATYQARPVGTHVVLSFLLPDGRSVTTPGIVRWVRDSVGETVPGMGVEFADLLAEDLDAIREFCKRRQPLYYDAD